MNCTIEEDMHIVNEVSLHLVIYLNQQLCPFNFIFNASKDPQ